jgi:hypothetical protein
VSETAADRVEAAAVADLLAHGRVIHALSAALTVAGVTAVPVLALLLAGPLELVLATLSVLAGVAELWFALRVGFDARIFERIARGELGLDGFDAAMTGLGLMPAGKAGRPMPARARGAMGLLARQAALLALQLVLLAGSGWLLALMRD